MAFTGTATVKQVSDRLMRITGLSLAAAGDAGTIGLSANSGTPGVRLPASFQPGAYSNPEGSVGLQDSVQCWCVPVTDVSNFAIPIRIVKTGTDGTDFLITMTNDSAATGSADLEIYVEWH